MYQSDVSDLLIVVFYRGCLYETCSCLVMFVFIVVLITAYKSLTSYNFITAISITFTLRLVLLLHVYLPITLLSGPGFWV